VSRAPAHAGSLRVTERLAFVTMFTVMAAFVVGLAVLAAKTGAGAGTGLPLVAVGARTDPIGSGQGPCPSSTDTVLGGANETRPVQPSGRLNARLTAALRAALGSNRAHVSAGVIDTVTGAEALYHPSEHYHAAGIATADILAGPNVADGGTIETSNDVDVFRFDTGTGKKRKKKKKSKVR